MDISTLIIFGILIWFFYTNVVRPMASQARHLNENRKTMRKAEKARKKKMYDDFAQKPETVNSKFTNADYYDFVRTRAQNAKYH